MTRFSRIAPIAVVIVIAAAIAGGAFAAVLGVGAAGSHSAQLKPGQQGLIGGPSWKCGDPPEQWGAIYYLAATGAPVSTSSTGSKRLREALVRPMIRRRANPREAVMWYGSGGPIGGRAQAEHMRAAAGTQPMAVYPVSSNPALCTTDRQLSDKPAAQPLLSAAQAALVSAGLASQQQLHDEGTAYALSDDPLDSSQAIITADVPTGLNACPPPAPNGAKCYHVQSLIAFVRLSDAAVTGVATGPSE